MKTSISSTNSSKVIGPYSPGIISGNLIFVSGHIALKSDGELVDGDISEETRQTLVNLQAILNAAGTDFDHVVKSTIYLLTMDDFKAMNDIYKTYFNQPYPARETIAVKELPKGAKVEISMIAIK